MGQLVRFARNAIILTIIITAVSWSFGREIPLISKFDFSFYPVLLVFLMAFGDMGISFLK